MSRVSKWLLKGTTYKRERKKQKQECPGNRKLAFAPRRPLPLLLDKIFLINCHVIGSDDDNTIFRFVSGSLFKNPVEGYAVKVIKKYIEPLA